MLRTIITLFAVAGVSIGKEHNAHSGPVDPAIEHVEWHYSDQLCLDLLLVDCATHVTSNDEQVCGSDGKTYANHCVFVHAVCEFAYGKQEKLHLQNHGPCIVTTPIVSTGGVVSSTATVPTVPSSAPVGNTGMSSPASSTMAPPASSTMAPPASATAATQTAMISTMTSTAQLPTTTDPVHGIIANVFCQNAGAINCNGSGMDIICGTNGVFYPNQCEFAKAKCNIPTLEHAADQNSCATPGK